MTREEIKKYAHSIIEECRIESDTIEYKKSASFSDKILKTACAYANNYMNRELGFIFIGIEEVDDKESGEKAYPKRPIYGVDERQIESIENSLKGLLAEIHPRISYIIDQDIIDDRIFLYIAVEPGSAGPYATSEKAEKNKKIGLKAGRYIRVRRDSRLPNFREEYELLKKFAGDKFSSALNTTATIDDLNYEYMKEYLNLTNAKDDTRKLSKLDMARSMKLISDSEIGGYRAKNFAVLMFSDEPQKYIPYARIEVIREISGTDKMESKVFSGPVWIQVKQVLQYFKDNILASCTIREQNKPGHRIIYNWPYEMFVELATNCVLHKDYDSDNYIGIYVYSDHLCFVNHNRPVPPVTIQDMNEKTEFNDRHYLNPELKEMFFALDLIESYGSGIRRAKNAMKKNGSPDLLFEPSNDTDNLTMVTAFINEEYQKIMKGNELNENNGETTPKTTLKTTLKTTPKTTSEQILKYMKENPAITISELADLLGITVDGVKYHTRKLQKEGRIHREGGNKGGYWVVDE